MRCNRILSPAGGNLWCSLSVRTSKVGGLRRKHEARGGHTSDMRRWRARHSIDDLQNCARSRPGLRERATKVVVGEKDNERREVKVRTPFWIRRTRTSRFTTGWVGVERKKVPVGNNDISIVGAAGALPLTPLRVRVWVCLSRRERSPHRG